MGDLIRHSSLVIRQSFVTPRAGVRAIPWRELDLCLVSPPGEASGRRSLVELTRAAFVLPVGGTVRALTDGILARWRIEPRVVAECDSLEVVKALVASGFGHAILPQVCLETEGAASLAVQVEEPLPRLPVAVLLARGRALSPTVQAFLEVMEGIAARPVG